MNIKSLKNQRLAIVDLETTGCGFSYDRVIEIGVIIVKDGQVEETFSTLINPEQHIPAQITQITNITTEDVRSAPTFRVIAKALAEMLQDSIFVAHNAGFDYGFLKAEFERVGITFQAKTLCTVRLSRKLFPQHPRHSLGHIIDRYQISTEARHRALADAQVLWDFLQLLPQHCDLQTIDLSITEILKTQYLPPQIALTALKTLPQGPGVYIFYDQNRVPLYIGKSINIQERVKQHFQGRNASSKELRLFTNVAHIEAIPTAGELGALLLESTLIKECYPLYNRQLRKIKRLFTFFKTVDIHGYFGIQGKYVENISTAELETVMGVFPSQRKAKEYLRYLSQKDQLCQKLLQLQKTDDCCFGYHLKRCLGSCIQKESVEIYNDRFLHAFRATRIAQWPYQEAITIEEVSKDGQLKEKVTIDQWCIIGHEKEGKTISVDKATMTFNLDDYKIIASHLKNRPNH